MGLLLNMEFPFSFDASVACFTLANVKNPERDFSRDCESYRNRNLKERNDGVLDSLVFLVLDTSLDLVFFLARNWSGLI